jgi:hypothetical protein
MTFKNVREEKKLPSENEKIAEFPKSQDVKIEAQMTRKFQRKWRSGETKLPRRVSTYRERG